MNKTPQQEPLFAVAERTGQFVVSDFTDAEPGDLLDSVTRDIHFINALSGISDINSRLGFVAALGTKSNRLRIQKEYGTSTDAVSEGVKNNIKLLAVNVKYEFARAIGMFAIADQDLAKQFAREKFEIFRTEFDGTGNAKKRTDAIEYLRKDIEAKQNNQTMINRTSQSAHLLDSLVYSEPVTTTESALEDEDVLTTQEKLRAILKDPRAGFYPATNEEKNQIIAYLDYLDNPAYHLGINNQFLEILNHEIRLSATNGKARGIAAITSITHELGDYYIQSAKQLRDLQDLADKIYNCPNPAVTLQEEIGDYHQGYAPLIRFMDLKEFSKRGIVSKLNRSPLRTKRNEDIQATKGIKNKVIEDQYTASNPTDAFKNRINDLIQGNNRKNVQPLKIKELRLVVQDAISDQAKRNYFAEARLKELSSMGIDGILRSVAMTASSILYSKV